MLCVVGSTACSDGSARMFKIEVPRLHCFFSGTGDMFAALTVVRLREVCMQAGLLETNSWRSPDSVSPVDLPLAHAVQKVLSSMQMVLGKTMKARDQEMDRFDAAKTESAGGLDAMAGREGEEKRRYLAQTKAAEVRLVRHAKDLKEPEVRYKIEALET